MHRIGEVAELAKVSIRLLHHYDDIGLLVPSGRSEGGYRLYSHADLQRLQQILFYRALEFPLDTIQQLMTAPDFDRQAALLQQRELIRGRAQQLAGVLALIDRAIADIDPDTGQEKMTMSTKEMFEVFPDLKQEDIIAAEARWGGSEAWKQSAARSRRYRREDWERMKREAAEVNERLEAAFSAGYEPDSPEAMSAIDAARELITRWHYDCSKEFHVRLTAMTSSDERFVKNIDRNCPGLAAWMAQAARANLRT